MKICAKCRKEKSLDQFSLNKKKGSPDTPAGRQPYCKECQYAYYQERIERIRPQIYAGIKRRSRRIRHEIMDLLAQSQCIDCGESDPVVLEFDHRDPSQKKFAISHAAGYGKEALEAEIAKCDIRCANCHRRRTAKQLGWYYDWEYGVTGSAIDF